MASTSKPPLENPAKISVWLPQGVSTKLGTMLVGIHGANITFRGRKAYAQHLLNAIILAVDEMPESERNRKLKQMMARYEAIYQSELKPEPDQPEKNGKPARTTRKKRGE